MLLQTNSYIVPKDRRAEHQRLVRKFRQVLARLGCDMFEVYEQVGANWSSAESTGRYVQIMRFRDRKHQLAVQAGERTDPMAQRVIAEFCDLINFPYQQQQGLFAVGFYTGVLAASPARGAGHALEHAPAEAAPARGGRRGAAAAGAAAGAATGFAMGGGLGTASGLGASAAGSVPSDVDEAAAVQESFGAEADEVGEEATADVATDELEPAGEESEQVEAGAAATADPEETPAEIEGEYEELAPEQAAPEPAEAAEGEPAGEVTPEEAAAVSESEPEAVEAEPVEAEALEPAAAHAPESADDSDGGLMDLDFELPDEPVPAEATDEFPDKLLDEAPAAEDQQPAAQAEAQPESIEAELEVAAVSAGQDEGGVEVIYEDLPEAPEAPAPAAEAPAPAAVAPPVVPPPLPAVAEHTPAAAADDADALQATPDSPPVFTAADDLEFLKVESTSRDADADAESDATPAAEAEMLPDEEIEVDDAAEAQPAGSTPGVEAPSPFEASRLEAALDEAAATLSHPDRNGQPPPVFATGPALAPDADEESAKVDSFAGSAFDNGWDEESAPVTPAAEAPPAQPAPPPPVRYAPVEEVEELVEEVPRFSYEDEPSQATASFTQPTDEEPAPAGQAAAYEAGRGQQRGTSDREDLDVLLAELDRALPPQRAPGGEYFGDDELERALEEALKDVHARSAAGHNNGGHHAGERMGR